MSRNRGVRTASWSVADPAQATWIGPRLLAPAAQQNKRLVPCSARRSLPENTVGASRAIAASLLLPLPSICTAVQAGKAPRNLLNSIESTSPRRLARPRTSPFHGGNTGSNPVGDAKHSKRLKFDLASSFHVTVCNVKLAPPVKPLFSAQSSQQPSIAPCVSHLSLPACRRPS